MLTAPNIRANMGRLLRSQILSPFIALMVDAASTFETSVNFYQIIQCSQKTAIFKFVAVRTLSLTKVLLLTFAK
jgi:hypothetical protein